MNIVDQIVKLDAAAVMKIMESDTFDINFRGTMGKTPLHHASEKATPAIVEMLLDYVIRCINKSLG
jgi:ankyrin repeat protein